MRSLALLVTTVMMTTIPTVGLATSAQQSNLFALFGSLRPDVELRPEQGGWSLQYCPDNTCERFCCSTSKCDGSLLDFSFLYLSHISGSVSCISRTSQATRFCRNSRGKKPRMPRLACWRAIELHATNHPSATMAELFNGNKENFEERMLRLLFHGALTV